MYEEIKQKFNDLEKKLSDPEIIKDQKELVKISQQHANLKKVIGLILDLEKTNLAIIENNEIVTKDYDPELKAMASEELNSLTAQATKLNEEIEDELHPASPNDKKNAIVEIRAGAGGDEAALFAGELFRMYARYGERRGLKLEIIDSSLIGIGGFKEVVFIVKAKALMVY